MLLHFDSMCGNSLVFVLCSVVWDLVSNEAELFNTWLLSWRKLIFVWISKGARVFGKRSHLMLDVRSQQPECVMSASKV